MERGKSNQEGFVGIQLIDDIISIIENANSTTNIRKTYTYDETIPQEDIEKEFNSLIQHNFAIEVNRASFSNGEANINVDIIEPKSSYIWYNVAQIPNNYKQSKSLSEMKEQVINPKLCYACRLEKENNVVFISWGSGKHWLYDFGSKPHSALHQIFDVLLKRPDKQFSVQELRDLGVEIKPKGLKEIFTKKFMRGLLYREFIICEGSSSVELRSKALIKGDDLIKIIRENLSFIYKESKRHRMRKLGLGKKLSS